HVYASLEDVESISEAAVRITYLVGECANTALYLLSDDQATLQRVTTVQPDDELTPPTLSTPFPPAWNQIFDSECAAARLVTSPLVIPLSAGSRAIGALVLTKARHETGPQPVNTALLQSIANSTAVALDRARFVAEQTKRQIEVHGDATPGGDNFATEISDPEHSQRRRATALQGVADALNQTDSLAELLPLFAARTAEALSASRVSIYVYSQSRDKVLIHYRHGETPAERERSAHIDPLPPAALLKERILIDSKRVITDPALLNDDSAVPSSVAALAPLLAQGEVVGALYVRRLGGAEFDSMEISLLMAIGGQGGMAVQRARLAESSQRQAEHLRLLNQIGQTLASSLDFDELCATMHEQIARVMAADAFLVALYDANLEQLNFIYMAEAGKRFPAELLPLDERPASYVARTRQSLLIASAEDPHWNLITLFGEDTKKPVSGIFVPIVHDNAVVGVLSTQSPRPAEYGPDDLSTLETIAQQAAPIFAHARLLATTVSEKVAAERHVATLSAVLGITRSLATVPTVSEMLDVMATQLAALVPFDGLAVYVRPDEGPPYALFVRDLDRGETEVEWNLMPGDSPFAEVFSHGEASLLNDTSLGCWRPDPTGPARRGRLMLLPMTIGDQVTGLLTLRRSPGIPFSDDEFALCRLVAAQTAVAVRDNALIAHTTAARLRAQRHAANLEAILATTQAIATQSNLDDTLGTLANHLEVLIPHARLIICNLDSETNQFTPRISRPRGDITAPSWHLPRDRGVIARVARGLQPAMINDAHLDPDSYYPPGFPRGVENEHFLVAPLVTSNRCFGVIVLDRSADDRFTDEEYTTFTILAGHANIALQASLLLDTERSRRRQALALVDVAASLNQAASLDDVMLHLRTAVSTVVGVEHCSIRVYDAAAAQVIASSGIAESDLGHHGIGPNVPRQISAVEQQLIATGQPMVGAALREALADTVDDGHTRWRGLMALPLRFGAQVQGVMYLWSKRLSNPDTSVIGDFDTEELALLEAIGGQAGVAIERARLHAETERQVAELRVLGGVNNAITRSLELREVIRVALQEIQEVVPYANALVTVWDEASKELRIAEAHGSQMEHLRDKVVPLDISVNGQVFQTGEVRRGVTGDGTPVYSVTPEPPGAYFLSVPLQINPQVIGTLYVDRDQHGPFSQRDEALFRLLAGQLALGIQRIQIFAVAIAARKRSERQAERLETVLSNSQRLALQRDLPATLRTFTEGLERLAPYSSCAVFRVDEELRQLLKIEERTIEGRGIAVERLDYNEGITGLVAASREALCISHAENDARMRYTPDTPEDRAFYQTHGVHLMAVPLLVEGILVGATTILREAREPFTDEEFAAVRVYAVQAAAAIRNAELHRRNRDLYFSGVRALASAVDAKDAHTCGHSQRVSGYARQIANTM
nr:GAF domain-containing protein [Chloroflexota bacterium]